MYLKKQNRGRGRRKRTYVSVAHNLWEGSGREEGQARPAIVMNLGKLGDLQIEQSEYVRVMAQALYDLRISRGDSPEQAVAVVQAQMRPAAEPIKILSSRLIGMRLLLEPVWEALGLGEAFRRYASQHAITFPLERVVFGMVLNRLVDPKSKRACNDWLQDLAYFPEAEGWEVQHFYRSMDLMHKHRDDVGKVVFEAMWELLPPELRSVWLVDTTSLYFEMTRSDEELADLLGAHETAAGNPDLRSPLAPVPQVVNEPFLRMRGHNKDGHKGDPQVVLASICSPDGQILQHKVYPGNTNDKTIGRDLLENLRPPEGTVPVWISDGGMVASAHVAMLDKDHKWHRITAESARQSKFAKERVMPLPGRYKQHPDKPKFSYREVIFTADDSPSGRAEKWILVRNAIDRERQLAKLPEHKTAVLDGLSRQYEEDPHGKSLCAIATHPTYKKFVKPSEKVAGQFVFNEEAYRREEQLAGTSLLRTTLTSFEAHAVHDAYQLLQEVERNHREFKTPMRLRPAYHRAERRILAHVMVNTLALNCLRAIETRTGMSPQALRDLTNQVTAVEMRQGSRTWWQLSELAKPFVQTLKRLGIEAPPKTWDVWRNGEPELRKAKLARRRK
ncbi:MAG: transposase [Cyanobacteria bacterium REEB65]|nr:transposase [Cyanobacteria bacterium REEB65]